MSLLLALQGAPPAIGSIEWFNSWFEDDEYDVDDPSLFLYANILGSSSIGPPNNRGFLINVGRLLNA